MNAQEEEGEEEEGEEEDERRHYPVLKYVDDAAHESRKRKQTPKKTNTQDSDGDSSYSVRKATKRAKPSTPSPTKKAPTKKAPKTCDSSYSVRKATKCAKPSTPSPTKKAPTKKAPKTGKGSRASGVKKRQAPPSSASQGPAVNPLKKWSGPSQGPIEFTPKPYNFDKEATPLWTYSSDGVARQSPNHRALGDIHFSPSLALGEDFHYWVQVGTKDGGCWELYSPGRQHPVHAGYILRAMRGKSSPRWVYRNEVA
ncbi:hypothetical protein RSAG8_13140, partial [Rhizoctonia solani AG-8 WAC10335]